MNYILEIPELLEAIFAFLSRKDLYRSCARVNHQWNAVSKLIIRKKRKAEFISIPGIRDNIIFHLYDDHLSLTEIVNYCKVSDIWSNILNQLSARTISLSMLYHHKAFLNAFRYSRRRFLYNKKRFICYFTRRNTQYYLKQDHELNRYYQDIYSLYELRDEFLRLARVCQSYDYKPNTEDEFRRISRVFQSNRH
ncbi:1531_t:CDS:1 [Funneliformis caledonium]|uniref:1531_t:CDS:1 n=1 Tax=Funneliformis caledonium TaxID=1117310 RepID=A0A9N9GTM5_9GLOM|nr:1531_t:CDS:1 [Funneliformis caledonium]